MLFELSGAIGGAAMMFLFPGLSYIIALNKYGRPSHYKLSSTFFFHVLAWAYLALFILVIIALVYIEAGKFM